MPSNGGFVFLVSPVLMFIFSRVSAEKEPEYHDKFANVEAMESTTSFVHTSGVTPVVDPLQQFLHGFIASLSVIIVSEIGDKTFFIAAIMAMKHSRLTVFAGAISALAFMTVLSVVFGYAATIIPRAYTFYVSTALFALFGLKMLREGYYMSPNEGQEEFEEVQSDLRKREDELRAQVDDSKPVVVTGLPVVATLPVTIVPVDLNEKTVKEKELVITNLTAAPQVSVEKLKLERESLTVDVETAGGRRNKGAHQGNVFKAVSRIFIQAFTLTFVAEWGDRSQLTTIILAAREDVFGVTLGGIFGHALCTGMAVMGGRFIAQRISVRTVTIIGGVVFLVFALSALIFNPVSDS
ncbi:transmembrane protein 165 isoform X2 [Nilaparvata lugens]|uniref:transmembrane protein 165 isoform X2 n=1 Tax=Nilaparvata lugens TaxID=108931 RepID=UPI00193D2B8F|nr:transmembrane protein 165 isoform X2 [Nilaparvata lugens]